MDHNILIMAENLPQIWVLSEDSWLRRNWKKLNFWKIEEFREFRISRVPLIIEIVFWNLTKIHEFFTKFRSLNILIKLSIKCISDGFLKSQFSLLWQYLSQVQFFADFGFWSNLPLRIHWHLAVYVRWLFSLPPTVGVQQCI